MRKLHVEELEPRQLLNGVSPALQPPPHYAPADTAPAPVSVRSFIADDGGDHGGSLASPKPREDRAQGEPSWTLVSSDSTGYTVLALAPQTSGAASPVSPASTGNRQEGDAFPALASQVFRAANLVGPASPGMAPAILEIETATLEMLIVNAFRTGALPADVEAELAGRLESVRTSPSAMTAAPLEMASPGRGTPTASPEAVTGMSAATFNVAPSPHLENVAAPLSPRADGQGLSVARGTVWAAREGEGLLSALDVVLQGSQASLARAAGLPAPAAPDGEQAEETLTLGFPLPSVPGVLTVLPAFDLPALEHGMKHFLGQLERMGQGLGASADGTGLQVWMIAGVAAATACEFARRQLRTSARVPDMDIRWNTNSPP
jgi:hypothetical protein